MFFERKKPPKILVDYPDSFRVNPDHIFGDIYAIIDELYVEVYVEEPEIDNNVYE